MVKLLSRLLGERQFMRSLQFGSNIFDGFTDQKPHCLEFLVEAAHLRLIENFYELNSNFFPRAFAPFRDSFEDQLPVEFIGQILKK